MVVMSQRCPPAMVWIVTGVCGDWSDRIEWPIEAHWDEAAAQSRVEQLDARERCADPENDHRTYHRVSRAVPLFGNLLEALGPSAHDTSSATDPLRDANT